MRQGFGNVGGIQMKKVLLSGIWAGLMVTTAWSQDFSATSKIDAVTVYPQGADVTRIATVDLPQGGHRILLTGLPAGIDPQSIRVEGSGTGQVEISSVDARDSYVGAAAADSEQLTMQKQIAVLTDERTLLDTSIADSNHQRTFLLNLADKQLTPQTTTDTSRGIDVAQLGGLLDLVGQKLAVLGEKVQKAQVRQREIDETVNDLSMKLNELHGNDKHQTDVAINVDAVAASALSLRVSYRVGAAGWSPYYDARLAIGKTGDPSKLALERRAVVTQSTDENWQDVALVLSTAQPTGSTAAPDVGEQEVGLPPPPMAVGADAPLQESVELNDFAGGDALAKSKDGETDVQLRRLAKPEKSAIAQRQAEIMQAGFQANYLIAGRVNIDNSGQTKKLKISSSSQDAKLSAVVAPRLDLAAYLTVDFTSDAAGPQLPGTVNLYRDGVYVGQGNLPMLAPKETASLGFGADDLVKVIRAEVKRLTGDEGIITASHIDERAWDITVKNLHDFAMPVTVKDRVPFTAVKDVTISEMPGMTEPTTRNVDKKRGVLAWALDMEAGGEKTVKTGYKISWPDGVQVGLVD
jgi:uncharacterized protein (TIGR02231 family)